MQLKKYYILFLVIVISLCTFIYLNNKYNISGVEMSLSRNVSKDQFNKLVDKVKISKSNINYSINYNDFRVIMTTGKDLNYTNMPIKFGRPVLEDEYNTIVLGDKVANLYFKSDNIINQEFSLFNKKYRIIGILENSDKIYIPYEEKLLNTNWSKVTVTFLPEQDPMYITINDVEKKLESNGINVIDKVVYRDVIYGYINLILVILLFVLGSFLGKKYRLIKRQTIEIYNKYQENRRTLGLLDYFKSNIKLIRNTLEGYIVGSVIIYLMYKAVKLLKLSPVIIPDNVFSIQSYYVVFNNLLKILISRLRNGVGDILIDATVINIVSLTIIAIILFRKNTKEGSGEGIG